MNGSAVDRARQAAMRLQPLACLLGLAAVATISAIGKLIEPFDTGTDVIEVTLLYLMAVLFLAVRFGFWPALLTAAVSVGSLDYLFLPPLYSFNVDTPQDAILLAFFAVTAATASRLAARAREQMMIARQNAETTAELYRFAGRLAATVTLDAATATAEAQIESMFGGHARIRLGDLGAVPPGGRSTPLHAAGETIGAVVVSPDNDTPPLREDARLFGALAELTGIAVGRQLLADRLAQLGIEQEAERLRSALLNSIAHDLTAPIASLASVLASLSSDYQSFDDAARRQLIAEAEQEAEHLHRFSANLVHMTRLEAGAIELRRERVEVGEMVRAALARARPIVEPRRIVIDIPAGLPLLQVDVVLMEQALFNLLENAGKYTPPEATVRISAQTAANGDRVVLQIADTGPGIPAADSERIFDKFYRAPPAPLRSRGTGLGLAICRGFVEAHGGTITAANLADGTGALFTITLPAYSGKT